MSSLLSSRGRASRAGGCCRVGGSGKRGRGPVCVRAERLAVAGGTCRVGRQLVRHLLSRGDEVNLLTRDAEGARAKLGDLNESQGKQLTIFGEEDDWRRGIAGTRAVISSLSYSEGNNSVVDAALEACSGAADTSSGHAHSPVFVLLSSIGAGDSQVAIPAPAKEPMKAFMEDKFFAEKYVRRAGLNHVILRLAPLNDVCDDSEPGRPVLTENPEAYGWITPQGTAELVTTCLESGKLSGAILGNTYSALDQNTVFISNPFLRPLEPMEALPFDIFTT